MIRLGCVFLWTLPSNAKRWVWTPSFVAIEPILERGSPTINELIILLTAAAPCAANPCPAGNRCENTVSQWWPTYIPYTCTERKYTCTPPRYTCTDSKYTCTAPRYTCTRVQPGTTVRTPCPSGGQHTSLTHVQNVSTHALLLGTLVLIVSIHALLLGTPVPVSSREPLWEHRVPVVANIHPLHMYRT